MTIHVLNGLTVRPYFPPVVGGTTMLLIETNQGPVLIDTAIGTRDYGSNGLMALFLKAMRSRFDLNETALYQVRRLGYQPKDIQHIIQSHLHIDHAGGLPDFPNAQVHLYKPEFDHIQNHPGWEYYPGHWAHGPHWVVHELTGEKWYEFDAVHLAGFDPELRLIPLVGHTPGHVAVAIRREPGWLLYGGDAVPFDMRVDEVPDWISSMLIGPHVPRLRAFMKEHPEVRVIGAHMSLHSYSE